VTDWQAIEALTQWLDDNDNMAWNPELRVALRVAKATEETGEVSAALIGVFAQNPRKGRTAEWSDVEAELCDVIITAMVALRSITPNAEQLFEENLRRVTTRALGKETQ
jgi:NTP pyrophosphatase (non-canonical NTP hydrolase)